MLRLLLSFGVFLIFQSSSFAQSCPDCEILIPADLPADTVYLSDAASGQVGIMYDSELSFRLPLTTTPVADENTPAGLPISQFEITGVANLPPGLEWTTNQITFNPSEMNDGCAKICGTPLVAGDYIVQVSLVATVFVISAETILDVPITIAPSQSITDGFTIRNGTGCGETLVSFRNNVPSNGQEGYSYQWDFGNGQMTDHEDPLDVEYNLPGDYIIDYQAVIDTTGYFLTNVFINEVECDDLIGGPDIQVKIFNTAGVEVFASAVIQNAETPLSISTNFKIEAESYTLSVFDADSGLAGADDLCGEFELNQLETGEYSGISEIVSIDYSILHPTDTIRSQDTVTVFAIPAEPQIEVEGELAFCRGDSTVLRASYEENIQWYADSVVLINETNAELTISEAGNYSVEYVDSNGCSIISDTITILINELPEEVAFSVENNTLTADDTSSLAQGTELQWYFDDQGIPDANEATFCINVSGVYGLEFTNTAGCKIRFEREVIYDEDFPNCVSDVIDINKLAANFKLYPNPATDILNIEFELSQKADIELFVINTLGQIVDKVSPEKVTETYQKTLSVGHLPNGIYFIKIKAGVDESSVRFLKR